MTKREKIISNYIAGYNEFDIDKMLNDLDDSIVFENISNGETNMSLTGLKSFKEQAEEAKSYFSSRTQTIKSFTHQIDETIVDIEYCGLLAMDFPEGLKRGDEINLKGRSIFKFRGDRIIRLTDIS